MKQIFLVKRRNVNGIKMENSSPRFAPRMHHFLMIHPGKSKDLPLSTYCSISRIQHIASDPDDCLGGIRTLVPHRAWAQQQINHQSFLLKLYLLNLYFQILVINYLLHLFILKPSHSTGYQIYAQCLGTHTLGSNCQSLNLNSNT